MDLGETRANVNNRGTRPRPDQQFCAVPASAATAHLKVLN